MAVKKAATKAPTKTPLKQAARKALPRKQAAPAATPAPAAAAEQDAAVAGTITPEGAPPAPRKRAAAAPADEPREQRGAPKVSTAGGPPQKKGTFRVPLRIGAVKALGFEADAAKATAGGLTLVKSNQYDFVYEGNATAMKALIKDLTALTVGGKGLGAGMVYGAKRAIVRVEAALAAGPFTGREAAPAE
jgi:hypothetical protein